MKHSYNIEREVIIKCLEAMSFTTRHLEQDFKVAISETSQNGIYQVHGEERICFKDYLKILVFGKFCILRGDLAI